MKTELVLVAGDHHGEQNWSRIDAYDESEEHGDLEIEIGQWSMSVPDGAEQEEKSAELWVWKGCCCGTGWRRLAGGLGRLYALSSLRVVFQPDK